MSDPEAEARARARAHELVQETTPRTMCGSLHGTICDAVTDALLTHERDLAAAREERDAYRRAKAENDERFMTERDTARADLATARLDGVRPEVAAFARLMEAKLRENDHKGGWQHEDTGYLYKRLREEFVEMGPFIAVTRDKVPASSALDANDRADVGREAADVANFAMMIADVCGALERKDPET